MPEVAEKVWKKEDIAELLATNDKAVTRGLTVLFKLQTASEQEWGVTVEHNGVGFNGRDAEFLTSLYKSFQKYGRLTDRQLTAARKCMKKYASQLARVANGKISLPA